MKRLLLLMGLLAILHPLRAQQPVCVIRPSGNIAVNRAMIEPFYNDPQIDTLQHKPISQAEITIGGKNYTVQVGSFENWEENEDGFCVIGIYDGDEMLLEVKQPEFWCKTYGAKGSTHNYREFTDNPYFIPLPMGNQATALAFLGWPYGGEMPYLTLIVVTQKEARMVFNRHVGINSIRKDGNHFALEVQTNLVEYDKDKNPLEKPDYHTIAFDGRILNYK